MLISEFVEVDVSTNVKYYEKLGYLIPKYKAKNYTWMVKRGTKISVSVFDLPRGSGHNVLVHCDGEDCIEASPIQVCWHDYIKSVKEDGKYYCRKCIKKVSTGKKLHEFKLKNGNSFEQWCIENSRQDVLDRWDYDLNDCKPSEITYGDNKKYYFKCPRGLHHSELKNIGSFTYYNRDGIIRCNTCNSFAQYLINLYGDNAINKYWSNKNELNPWEISRSSKLVEIWINCQEKKYHGDYLIKPNEFINGNRCSYCANYKVHPLDSLGKLLEDKGLLHLWSDKNKKSPYEFKPYSNKSVWWKCPDGIHKDYPRKISIGTILNFRCPECSYSKGEEKINNYLINKGFIKISQKDFDQLINENKYNKNYYIPQKEFEGLVGLGGGLLSYDFYLPKLNILIEYQGEYHDGTVSNQSKKQFEKQQEHDKRKREYAKNNNINLLEIWYNDFNRIEEILERELLD